MYPARYPVYRPPFQTRTPPITPPAVAVRPRCCRARVRCDPDDASGGVGQKIRAVAHQQFVDQPRALPLGGTPPDSPAPAPTPPRPRPAHADPHEPTRVPQAGGAAGSIPHETDRPAESPSPFVPPPRLSRPDRKRARWHPSVNVPATSPPPGRLTA